MIGKKNSVLSLILVTIVLSALFSSCAAAVETNAEDAVNGSVGSFQSDRSSAAPQSSDYSTPEPAAALQSSGYEDEPETTFEIEIIYERAQSSTDTPLLRDLRDYEIIRVYPAGSVFIIMEYETPLWAYVQSEDGDEGFLYSDDLNSLGEDGVVTEEPLGQAKIAERLRELHELFPSGYYWNHIGYDDADADYSGYITSFPCDHNVTGTFYCNHYNGATVQHYPEYGDLYQCLGFASMISDQVFGDEADISVFSNVSYLRLGDHIRLHDYEHSMIVISIEDDVFTLAEVNENYNDCAISWERQISKSELQDLSWDSEYLTRYPTFRDDAGNLLTDGSHLTVLADITV